MTRYWPAMLLAALTVSAPLSAQSVLDATLAEADQKTPEVSTNQLREILRTGSAAVFDSRAPEEYALSHIPGAMNVAARPGQPAHLYVSDTAEIGRRLAGDKARAIVLYCNGPFCGRTKRLSADLVAAGYRNVRRYQLGAPSWRALSGAAMQTETAALGYIARDPTAVWIDAREPAAFRRGSLPGARNVPAGGLRPGKDQGVIVAAKDDGRLPMADHNTRILVFGDDATTAQAVADALAREAFHNVSFVASPFAAVRAALRARR